MAMDQNKQNEKDDSTLATGTTGLGGSDKTASNQNNFSGTGSSTGSGTTGSSTTGSSTGSGAKGSSMGSGTTGTSSTGSSGSGSKSSGQGSTGDTGSSATTDQVATTVGNVLRGDTSTAAGTARGIVSQVKESGGKVASEALGSVKEKAFSAADEQKATLAQGLGSVAQTIRQVGETLKGSDAPGGVAGVTAQYGDSLARQVEQFSGYLEKHNVSELLRDVEGFARRNPAYFIGGAFLLGLLGARFLKSSAPNQALMAYEGGSKTGKTNREIFHHHEGNEKIDGGHVSGSGEGVRPV